MNGLTLTQAARHISHIVGYRISPSTIRSWCDAPQFQPFLTDDATPEPGTTRRLQEHDIAVMLRIAEYRQRNLTFDAIALRLTEPAEDAAQAPESPQTPTDAPGTTLAPIDVPTIVQTESRLSAHESRITALESQSRVNSALVIGFIAGAAIVAIIALLIVMLR